MLTWVDLLALMVLALSLALGYRGACPRLGRAPGPSPLRGRPGPRPPRLLDRPRPGARPGGLGQKPPLFLSEAAERGLGLLGGGLLGLFLAAAIWTGFPSEPAPSGGIRYPSLRLPTPIYQGVAQSPFARRVFAWAWGTPWARKALGLEGQHLR